MFLTLLSNWGLWWRWATPACSATSVNTLAIARGSAAAREAPGDRPPAGPDPFPPARTPAAAPLPADPAPSSPLAAPPPQPHPHARSAAPTASAKARAALPPIVLRCRAIMPSTVINLAPGPHELPIGMSFPSV